MQRKTKIICTLGPASERQDTIIKMGREGMNVARINASHGDHAYHLQLIKTVRAANRKAKLKIKILLDLEGYRLRVGELKYPVELMKHQQVWLNSRAGNVFELPIESDIAVHALKKGMDVFIDDGNIHLKVMERSAKGIRLEVEHGGVIKSRKGINIPKLKLQNNIMTAKDKRDILFGIRQKADFISQSFVRNKKDISRVKKLVEKRLPKCCVIAKIENQDGVRNMNDIIDACDGLMVARGDLGVSLPIYEIPLIQKEIILSCNISGKMVVTATQMLESMIENSRPTRAEVSDVANAILDGTDYVMLSAETAVGSFPVKAVRMMRQIIEHTEKAR